MEDKKSKKTKIIKILGISLVVLLALICLYLYMVRVEFVCETYDTQSYGANTSYDGGQLEVIIDSPYGINIELAGDVYEGTMICEALDSNGEMITRVKLTGSGSEDFNIGHEFDSCIIHIYTDDEAEADVSLSIGKYVFNFEYWLKLLNIKYDTKALIKE